MASDALGLLFKIKANSSDAQSDIKKLRNVLDSEVSAMTGKGSSSFAKLGQSIGLTTTQMSGLATAAPIAGAAIAAVGGAAIAAGVAIFGLAQKTAEYGSKINDASLKTGLTAETLSGLDLQLKQSGTSMEALTRGIFLLQKNLEAMADGSKKGTAELQKLGLKPGQLGDTEAVLRTVLKYLAALPDEQKRNAEGARLMGRSYQELAVFVADTNGNIDQAIEKARELGLVMSQDAAKSADEFGDKLDELSNRAEGMGRTVGLVVIPAIMDAMKQLEVTVKGLPDVVEGATFAAKTFIHQYLIFPLQLAQKAAQDFKNIFGTLGGLVSGGINEAKAILDRQAARLKGNDIAGGADDLTTGTPRGTGSRGSRGRAAKPETDEDRALKLLKQKQEELDRLTKQTDAQRLATKLLSEEYNGLSIATFRSIIQTQRDIDAKKAATLAAELTAKAEKMVTEFVKEQVQELNALRGITPTAMDAVDELIKSVEVLNGPFVLPFNEQLMRLRALAIDGLAAIEKLKDAIATGWGAEGPPGGLSGIDPNNPAGVLPKPPDIPPPTGAEIWISTVSKMRSVGMEALGSLARGVGSMVEQWVLMGNAAPGAMKKMVASVLAGVAAQCATLGIMELAYAAAGLTPWGLLQFGSPAAHLKSAAFFFAAAATAGVMGRVVAGNSFAQGAAGGAGGGSGGGGTTGNPAERGPNIIEQNRNQQDWRKDIYVHIETNEHSVIDAFERDVRGNGRMRQMLVLKGEV